MTITPLALPDRRGFLASAGGGFGAIALDAMLAQDRRCVHAGEAISEASSADRPWFDPARARVKRIIWLFMHGGPSHVDLLDPKPELGRLAGQPLPESFGPVRTRRKVAENPLLGPIKPFRPRGQSGLEISDFLPEISRHADDLCVIRGLHGDSVNHPQSVYQWNTGSIRMGRPSVGSWVAYGLGSEAENLPTFVVLPDPAGGLKGGPPAWGNGFLPANFQGVTMRSGPQPILHLKPPDGFSATRQREAIELLQSFNREHRRSRDNDHELAARIEAYELAFRMQSSATELVDIAGESDATRRLYGLDQPHTKDFGNRCLLARRMVQRGVRFVQVYSGDTNGWDAHNDVLKNHSEHCLATDQPVAALLSDLKRLGLWQDTLVIWGGEFGRMPMGEAGKGRDHNPWGYSMWLAGGAVRGGIAHGATDPIGLRATEDRVHVRDLHATLLRLLGVDSRALSFYHNGLEERLIGPTDDARVVTEILS